jgi:hypothetical protein
VNLIWLVNSHICCPNALAEHVLLSRCRRRRVTELIVRPRSPQKNPPLLKKECIPSFAGEHLVTRSVKGVAKGTYKVTTVSAEKTGKAAESAVKFVF